MSSQSNSTLKKTQHSQAGSSADSSHNPLKDKAQLIAFGEALFDEFPDQKLLGGAPLNFCVHSAQLGIHASLWTAVGYDEEGETCLATLQKRGVDCSEVHQLTTHPTGKVKVSLQAGEPSYEICTHVAWDSIPLTANLIEKLSTCHAFYFGSLAARTIQNRDTLAQVRSRIQEIKNHSTSRVVPLVFFDLNLRAPFIEWSWIQNALHMCDVLKVNDEEWEEIQRNLLLDHPHSDLVSNLPSEDKHNSQLNVDEIRSFMREYGISHMVITQGALGCSITTMEGFYRGQAVIKQEGGDAVGAGDACAATILYGLLHQLDLQTIMNQANRVGAFVASQSGALPLGIEELVQIDE